MVDEKYSLTSLNDLNWKWMSALIILWCFILTFWFIKIQFEAMLHIINATFYLSRTFFCKINYLWHFWPEIFQTRVFSHIFGIISCEIDTDIRFFLHKSSKKSMSTSALANKMMTTTCIGLFNLCFCILCEYGICGMYRTHIYILPFFASSTHSQAIFSIFQYFHSNMWYMIWAHTLLFKWSHIFFISSHNFSLFHSNGDVTLFIHLRFSSREYFHINIYRAKLTWQKWMFLHVFKIVCMWGQRAGEKKSERRMENLHSFRIVTKKVSMV